MGAGARLVTHAKTMKNAKAVLSPDKSEYMLVPCHARTWFVVSLLEDLFLEQAPQATALVCLVAWGARA